MNGSGLSNLASKRIAITGGTGFVGGHLIDRLVSEGAQVRALARNPAKLGSRADAVDIITGDLGDADALGALAAGCDAVIHLAAMTHALSRDDFRAANVEGTARVATAAASANALMVHISSIAARAPDLSDYAWSKAESEKAVASSYADHAHEGAPGWICLRAPAIYGPGDEATLPYFKMVKLGIAPEPMMSPPGRASFLYVDDVIAAIISSMSTQAGRIYEIGDESPEGHSWAEIGIALGAAFGKRPFALKAPRPLLEVQAGIAEGIAHLRNEPTFVTRGKIAEFFHPDWVARDGLLSDATDWHPTTPLEEGFAKTLKWYQEEGLL